MRSIKLPQVSLKMHSARDMIYEMLMEKIVSNQIPAGTHLNERVIAEQTGVSTTPIKEAIRRLEQEGLVMTKPRKGTFVSSQVMRSIEEITCVRSSLEGVSARFAAQKATDEEIDKLKQLISKMEKATTESQFERLMELNAAFHRHIHEAAKNNYILQQIYAIRAYDRVIRKKALVNEHEIQRAFREHQSIFTKIEAKDSDGAEQSMIKHIRRTLSFVQGMESQFAES